MFNENFVLVNISTSSLKSLLLTCLPLPTSERLLRVTLHLFPPCLTLPSSNTQPLTSCTSYIYLYYLVPLFKTCTYSYFACMGVCLDAITTGVRGERWILQNWSCNGCKLLRGCWEPNCGPLPEQPVFWVAPHESYFLKQRFTESENFPSHSMPWLSNPCLQLLIQTCSAFH